jgi:hypothetical protein
MLKVACDWYLLYRLILILNCPYDLVAVLKIFSYTQIPQVSHGAELSVPFSQQTDDSCVSLSFCECQETGIGFKEMKKHRVRPAD